MDIFTAIKERRSCRKYLPDSIDKDQIDKILEAAIWAPSPANNQSWEFIVITNKDMKEKIFNESERCKKYLFEKSGWKWLNKYRVDFLLEVPVIIAVIGDPKKTGADMFLDEGALAYRECCAAAIQNMILAAHAIDLGTLWFTLFDKEKLKSILGVDPDKSPISLVLVGKVGGEPIHTPRTDVKDKTRYID